MFMGLYVFLLKEFHEAASQEMLKFKNAETCLYSIKIIRKEKRTIKKRIINKAAAPNSLKNPKQMRL
jgi:hypothetical protein